MGRTFGRRCWIGLVAGVGFLVLAGSGPASAATQIGQTFTPNSTCGGDTFFQSVSLGAQYSAPDAGVITSWAFQAGPSPPSLKFKVGRPAGGNVYTIVGESNVENPTPNVLNSYETRISVQAGDGIGFFVVPSGACAFEIAPTGNRIAFFTSDLPPGMTVAFDDQDKRLLDVSAILEPDCDNDGFGDETQDNNLSTCHPRTLTLDANKNKVKKGKKVKLSGRIVEIPRQGATGCVANQAVEVQRKKPSQSAFTTVEQVQTDAGGSFSAKEKVKKTFEYRAQVPETPTCDDGLSNTEKVKVRKR